MYWLAVAIPALLAGLSGVAGSLLQRRFHLADEERRDVARKKAQRDEQRRLSDAASLRLLHPSLHALRHEFEEIAPGLRNGTYSMNVFQPESSFYVAAEEFRHQAASVWLLDDALRTSLETLLTQLREFTRQTTLLATTKQYGPGGAGGRSEYVAEVTRYSAEQTHLLQRFLEVANDFTTAMATTVGMGGIL